MIIKIVIAIALVIAAVLVYAAVQPADYTIRRSLVIRASAEKIFPYVNNSKLMNSWNPFLAQDPTAQVTYSGPDEGVGSQSAWKGGKMGTGQSTVTESVPNERVGVTVAFTEPFVDTQRSEMTLVAQGDSTELTWQVQGRTNFVGRVICVFWNMNAWMEKTFDAGLTTLKSRLETSQS